VVLNYARVTGVTTTAGGAADGVIGVDVESGRELRVPARVIVNATGPFADGVRRLALPGAPALIAPSQGIHLVFDRSFLPGACGLMVPKTPDGRVMFAVPWHGHTLVGTTDTAIGDVALEPRPLEEEIAFVLETAAPYFEQAPARSDVLSAFAGIRPLVARNGTANTASLSRDHTICVEASRLVTITGGKWTTYRRMAEDAVDAAVEAAGLPRRACLTSTLRVHGWDPQADRHGHLAVYGSDARELQTLVDQDAGLNVPLHPGVPCTGAMVTWAARAEMARTVEDVLARRCRALFLDAAVARTMAPQVAAILARELGRDAAWQQQQVAEFTALAERYVVRAGVVP
jgi:glycerol-3-phosphate dehydrogenase